MARDRYRTAADVPLVLPPSVAALLGNEAADLLAALAQPVPTSVRYNPAKASPMVGTPVPWCATGRYLDERPVFTLDPHLHAGCYYVQEGSSMLLEQAILQSGMHQRTLRALDLCAAPGGKSGHLASLITSDSLLVCNEPVPPRRAILAENLWKHGRAGIVITGSQPADFAPLGPYFDLVLVDAPCSGEGMFRKDPFARTQWNEALVSACARTQADILDHAWNAVAPGGLLIYSTCTWERTENEEQVQRLIGSGGEHVVLNDLERWGVLASDLGYRCYPHRVRGEGFFIAVVKKPGGLPLHPVSKTDSAMDPLIGGWLREPSSQAVIPSDAVLYSIPDRWMRSIEQLQAHVRMHAPGIPIAERKGDQWRPHAALALNDQLNADAFTHDDLDLAGALDYLRGGTAGLRSNPRTDERVRLVCYEGKPLGWVYAAGQRWNNGWPKEWRIRMR